MRASPALPEPTPEARATSEALSARIVARIQEAGGWIGFDDYMALALYTPGLGYYSGPARKFGAGGDFITAPELSGLFGACLARQCAHWFAQCGQEVIEFGAGSGALAARMLGEFERLGLTGVRYRIVELSAELAARQRARIAQECPAALPRVSWLQAWPERIDGVVLANELLDAMPVRAFALEPAQAGAPARVLERGVRLADTGFAWATRPAAPDFAARVRERVSQGAGVSDINALACEGELGEQAQAWVAEAARRLARGAILLIDYGFARPEFHHVQRAGGTLMCHYRHHAHGDPFFLPGLQDITAHVDFTAVAQAALGEGLQVLGFLPQARLLTNLGLLDDLAARHRAAAAAEPLAWAREAQAAQMLLSPAEMGELFKAIGLSRGLDSPGPGFARGDRPLALEGS